MEKVQFLKQHLFKNLTPVKAGKDVEEDYMFSEEDFEKVLDRAKHFGIGIYTIETFFKTKAYSKKTHDDYKKKATDYNWYQRAFSNLRKEQSGLTYTGTYKVSPKLLAKETHSDEEE